ncbi:hypothetical protein [Nocardioides sp. GXZ039]|uniref:hypothetical protein n=1 Tax=Nocardioides sp. GXZ039 TaxID=3136018 RepID=UPI0030F41238
MVAAILLVGGGIFAIVALNGDDDKDTAGDDSTRSSSPLPTATGPDEEPGTTEVTPEPVDPGSAGTDDAAPLVGTWTGTYTCNQGESALDLEIASSGGGAVTAVFTFGPTETNPDVERGSFAMEGTYQRGELSLVATEWIDKPGDYLTVDLFAIVTEPASDTISGEVRYDGCTDFEVIRQ